jgi:stress response protein SCP2
MAGVELVKRGQRVELTKGKNLSKINVALGWDTNKYAGGYDFDLDVSVFMATVDEVTGNQKVRD